MILYRAAAATEISHQLREIHVLAVPYGVPTDIRSWEGTFAEDFAPGSFAGADARRVKALRDHSPDRAIGRTKTLDTKATDGLHAVLKVSSTALGDESLVLAADGVLDVSIGFVPGTERWSSDGSAVTRTAVELMEISLVPLPAYAGAAVLGVRSAFELDHTGTPVQALCARCRSAAGLSSGDVPSDLMPEPTPRLDQLRLEALMARYPERTRP